MSDGTVRYLHRLLRAALQHAVSEDEILTENIAKKLRLNHKYRPKFKAWSRAEATTFLDAIREDRLYALYAVALSLDLRGGEALGLRWTDMDLDNSPVRVNQALHGVDGALKLGEVKTDGEYTADRRTQAPRVCSSSSSGRAGAGEEERGEVYGRTAATCSRP